MTTEEALAGIFGVVREQARKGNASARAALNAWKHRSPLGQDVDATLIVAKFVTQNRTVGETLDALEACLFGGSQEASAATSKGE